MEMENKKKLKVKFFERIQIFISIKLTIITTKIMDLEQGRKTNVSFYLVNSQNVRINYSNL